MTLLSPKMASFIDALSDLCTEHSVQMTGHGNLYLSNLIPNVEEPIDFPEIEDMS